MAQQPITDLFTELISKSINNGFNDSYITHCLNIIEENYSECHNIQEQNYHNVLLDAIQSINIDKFYIALAFAYMNDELEPEDTLLFIVTFFMKLLSSDDCNCNCNCNCNFEEIFRLPKIRNLIEFNLNEMIPDYQLLKDNNDNFVAYKVIYSRLHTINPSHKAIEILRNMFVDIETKPLRRSVRQKKKPERYF